MRPLRGITVIPTCGAAPAPVMPQVRRTWGRAESRENPQVQTDEPAASAILHTRMGRRDAV